MCGNVSQTHVGGLWEWSMVQSCIVILLLISFNIGPDVVHHLLMMMFGVFNKNEPLFFYLYLHIWISVFFKSSWIYFFLQMTVSSPLLYLSYQNIMPISAAMFHSERNNPVPQCPPRLDVQMLTPVIWSRMPNHFLKPEMGKVNERLGWMVECVEPLIMMALHIPEENRSETECRCRKLLSLEFSYSIYDIPAINNWDSSRSAIPTSFNFIIANVSYLLYPMYLEMSEEEAIFFFPH